MQVWSRLPERPLHWLRWGLLLGWLLLILSLLAPSLTAAVRPVRRGRRCC